LTDRAVIRPLKQIIRNELINMITMKKKKQVLEIISKMDAKEIKVLNKTVNAGGDLTKKHYYVDSYYSAGRNYKTILSGAVLEPLLVERTSGNDGQRGGQNGKYIIFKNTESNRKTLVFVKSLLEVLLDDEELNRS